MIVQKREEAYAMDDEMDYVSTPEISSGTGLHVNRGNYYVELLVEAKNPYKRGLFDRDTAQYYATAIFPGDKEPTKEDLAKLVAEKYPDSYPKPESVSLDDREGHSIQRIWIQDASDMSHSPSKGK